MPDVSTSFSAGNKYVGGFCDDSQHGQGVFTHHNGHVYEGGYNTGLQCGHGKLVYHSGTIFEGHFKDSRIQYGELRIASEEFVASFEEAAPGKECADPMTAVYNVQLSSHDGKFFKPLQFCEGNFLDTEAVMTKSSFEEETKQQGRDEVSFIPLVVEEELIKRKNLHERPPALSPEPRRHRAANEDMEDD